MAASTHPPFDPELSAVLAALPADLREPMTIEDIPARREQLTQLLPADDDALRREGAVELEERQIPGPEGAPDLSVLILRPADYAARLSRAGVPVEFHLWPGGFHGFDMFAPQSALAQASRATRLGYVRRILGS